jgi:hypothetical protein
MRAIEFETRIDSSGQLKIPEEAVGSLPIGGRARVILLLDGNEAEAAGNWDRFAARSISDYYCPEDAIYDDYPRG